MFLCEEQKQIVLIFCLVKQVVSTLEAHAVWLKATGCEVEGNQGRWQGEQLGKQNIHPFDTVNFFFFTDLIILKVMTKKIIVADTCLFRDSLSVKVKLHEWMEIANHTWLADYASGECDPVQLSTEQTSEAAHWEKVWRTKNRGARLLTVTHCD